MKNTTIDRSLLPHMWLTWETTKGKFWLDCDTGEKSTEKPNINFNRWQNEGNHLINSGSKPRYAYAKYHEDIERLELAEVTIETTRSEARKEWKYSGNKYFLGKDKSVIDENGTPVGGLFVLSRYHTTYNFKEFLSMFYRIVYHKAIVDEFKKFLGSDTYTVGSGRVVTVSAAWHIQEWYKTKQKVRGPGKQQKLTDKLTAMPVLDITEIDKKYPGKPTTSGYYGYSSGIIYFERLDDGWSVLRVFSREYYNGALKEIERMYLNDDGSNRIVAPSNDGWIPSKLYHYWSEHKIVNKNEAMEKCKRLKYILPLVENVEARRIKPILMNILRFPELEQMINLGYKNAAQNIARENTPKADLRHMFGEYYNEKESTLLRKVGMTKHQFDKYMSKYENSSHSHQIALKEMRRFFENDFIHLDNVSFDKYFDAFRNMHRGWRTTIYPQLDDMDVDRKKFIKNMVRLGEKNPSIYTMVDDTLIQYTYLNRGSQPIINWYFDSYSDAARVHDAIDELKRAQDAERRAIWDKNEAERRKKEEEKRIKLDEERKKYEYEDDTYIVRLPKDSNEIIAEGNKQRICIGGYTTRHALGQTNLFFLRRKSEPDAPFYAIEMNNNNVIVQIHGYANAWLGNNPDAIPTVVRWLRKNGVKCDQKILTCKAKGYCAINEYVPMPVVD